MNVAQITHHLLMDSWVVSGLGQLRTGPTGVFICSFTSWCLISRVVGTNLHSSRGVSLEFIIHCICCWTTVCLDITVCLDNHSVNEWSGLIPGPLCTSVFIYTYRFNCMGWTNMLPKGQRWFSTLLGWQIPKKNSFFFFFPKQMCSYRKI